MGRGKGDADVSYPPAPLVKTLVRIDFLLVAAKRVKKKRELNGKLPLVMPRRVNQ